jgi:hypothetical protein
MGSDVEIERLERELDDLNPETRARALARLVALAAQGEVDLPPERAAANMHCHTFYSYNGYGYSPTGLAWLGRKLGLQAMGIVDFDVLDGVDEFLGACDAVGLRGSAGMETRVFVPEFAEREINSPGEPGIFYHMGIGFTSGKAPEGVAHILDGMRARAEQRNRGLIERVNAYLDPVAVDYTRDVLPLTPAGNATERHITVAYADVAARTVDDPAAFWSGKLDLPQAQVAQAIEDPPLLHNLIRSVLMKQGGVGYVEPDYRSFPSVEEVNALVVACGALPCATWLDGTSAGEQNEEELLRLLIDKGVVALNIVPDRNWNLADPQEKRLKVRNLYAVVELAAALDLPLNVGTEMNKVGLKLVDDFDAPELAPVGRAFLDGAMFIYGHTAAQRALGLGFQSAWAQSELSTRAERNAFYTALGCRVPPGQAGLERLRGVGVGSPEDIVGEMS